MIKYSKTVIRDIKTDDIPTTLLALHTLNSNWKYASSTDNFNVYKIEEHLTDTELKVVATKDIRGLQ